MADAQREHVYTELMRGAHELRGSLSTLLLLVQQLGVPAHDTTEELKQVAEKKLRQLADVADRIEALANQLNVSSKAA